MLHSADQDMQNQMQAMQQTFQKIPAPDSNVIMRFDKSTLKRLEYVPKKTQNHFREDILSFYVNPILGHFGFMVYSGKLQISTNKIWIIKSDTGIFNLDYIKIT